MIPTSSRLLVLVLWCATTTPLRAVDATTPAIPTTPSTDAKPAASAPARSDLEWRLELEAGLARETVRYEAGASVASAQAGYASTSSAASPSLTTAMGAIAVTAMQGMREARARPYGGLVWGLGMDYADYGTRAVRLPATDADVSSTSANGSSISSRISLQRLAIAMPLGWAWQVAPRWTLEGCAVAELGITHLRYTSAENEVYGRNAPLGLYDNSFYNLAYALGATLHLGYRTRSSWLSSAGLGYRWGRSLAGSTSDQVTYYQGGANPQAGSYRERVALSISEVYLAFAVARCF